MFKDIYAIVQKHLAHAALQPSAASQYSTSAWKSEPNKICQYSSPAHSHELSPAESTIALQFSTELLHDMDLSCDTLIDNPPPSLPSLDTQSKGLHMQLANDSIGIEDENIHVP